jgi:hypothetical protein
MPASNKSNRSVLILYLTAQSNDLSKADMETIVARFIMIMGSSKENLFTLLKNVINLIV